MTSYKCPSCTATFTRDKSYEESAAAQRFIGIRCDNCGRFLYGPDCVVDPVRVLVEIDVMAGDPA